MAKRIITQFLRTLSFVYSFHERIIKKTLLNFLINPVQKKRKSLLNDIGGGFYVEKLRQKIPPLNKSKLREKREEENKIKR